ncbi:MAG: portal protein [Desulfovibrio sp.]
MDDKTLRKRLEARRRGLSEERQKWLDHWRELSEFILPDNGVFSFSEDRANDGGKKRSKIFDYMPQKAARDFASGLHSCSTSPARPWFRLGLYDPAVMDRPGVRQWLKACDDVLRYVFGKSNLYKALPAVYLELGTFSTGAMGVFDDFDKVVRFRSFTVGEYMLDQDDAQVVDTCIREIWMTARQMVQQFGEDAVSDVVRRAWKDGRTMWRAVIHAVEANDDFKPNRVRVGKNKPFRSVYYEDGGAQDKILRISGYDHFPILAPRTNLIGSNVYGVGAPGMVCLPDVKSLYLLNNKTLVGVEKSVDPPLVANGDAKDEIINTMPGGVSYETATGAGQGLRALYEVRPDLNAAQAKVQDLREAIRSAYFNDLFLLTAMSDRREITAREISERHEEKLIMLAPLTESIHTDLLDPLIDIVFERCVQHGLIPPPPPELAGQDLKVEYIDILTQAQKLLGITANSQLAGYVGSLAALFPEVRHKFNALEAVDDYADRLGVPPKLVRSDTEVKKLLQQEQQAQAQAQQAAMLERAAQGAETLSNADMGGNNALTALVGAMGVAQ